MERQRRCAQRLRLPVVRLGGRRERRELLEGRPNRELECEVRRVGPRAPNEELADWLRRLSAGRTRMELVGAWHLDVADPAGQGALAIEQTADEVQDLVDRLADLAWPRRR